MAKHNRYSLRYLENNIDRWFQHRQRIFIYHYRTEPQVDERWQDLTRTGCRYVGWLPLGYQTRGEIWLYPTQRHKTMIQMIVAAEQLMWKRDFLYMRKQDRKRARDYAQQIKQLVKKNGQHWFYQ